VTFRRSDTLYKQLKTLSKKLVYFVIVIHVHSAFICHKLQVYDIMVEYNNSSI